MSHKSIRMFLILWGMFCITHRHSSIYIQKLLHNRYSRTQLDSWSWFLLRQIKQNDALLLNPDQMQSGLQCHLIESLRKCSCSCSLPNANEQTCASSSLLEDSLSRLSFSSSWFIFMIVVPRCHNVSACGNWLWMVTNCTLLCPRMSSYSCNPWWGVWMESKKLWNVQIQDHVNRMKFTLVSAWTQILNLASQQQILTSNCLDLESSQSIDFTETFEKIESQTQK